MNLNSALRKTFYLRILFTVRVEFSTYGVPGFNFCSNCGSKNIEKKIPEGDNRERIVCNDCGIIHYFNPRIVVGCIPTHEKKVLLCKRAIEPRKGYWTTPCGFMENGETLEEGAKRETLEEARARVRIIDLQTIYSLPHINQVYFIFLSELLNLDFGAGDETLDAKLVPLNEVNYEELAFTGVIHALKSYQKDLDAGQFRLHRSYLPIDTQKLH